MKVVAMEIIFMTQAKDKPLVVGHGMLSKHHNVMAFLQELILLPIRPSIM